MFGDDVCKLVLSRNISNKQRVIKHLLDRENVQFQMFCVRV